MGGIVSISFGICAELLVLIEERCRIMGTAFGTDMQKLLDGFVAF